MDKVKAKKLNHDAKVKYARGLADLKAEGWAKIYVEAELSIPESWRDDFYTELVSKNENYKRELEESINYFGVRWNNS